MAGGEQCCQSLCLGRVTYKECQCVWHQLTQRALVFAAWLCLTLPLTLELL